MDRLGRGFGVQDADQAQTQGRYNFDQAAEVLLRAEDAEDAEEEWCS